jgi:DNA-binding response OmpR family regulator
VTVRAESDAATEDFLTWPSGIALNASWSTRFPYCPVRKSSVGDGRGGLEDGSNPAEHDDKAVAGWSVKVLVVEDEAKVARALKEGLEGEHYDVVVAKTGEEGFFRANAELFDLVILDLMLPRRDGLEVLGTLRSRGIQTPVLILTARDTIDDRVHGLDRGADDYLVKPFAFPELLARIRALLRRGRMDRVLKLQHDDLEMDLVTRRVTRRAQVLDLTAKEFEILEYLLRHQDRVVSREMLARDVWQVAARATPLDNVIDVTIARLRRKVDDPFDRKLIHTVRGVGFVLGHDRR